MAAKPHLIIHEQNSNGQHRMLYYRETKDGFVQVTGQWYEGHQIAECGMFLANSGMVAGLPQGVFIATPVAYDTLA
jgi:hypothetical protein